MTGRRAGSLTTAARAASSIFDQGARLAYRTSSAQPKRSSTAVPPSTSMPVIPTGGGSGGGGGGGGGGLNMSDKAEGIRRQLSNSKVLL